MRLVLSIWLVAALAFAAGPQQPLRRSLFAGQQADYHVRLRIEVGLSGQQPEKLGATTYAFSLERRVEAEIEWNIRRRVLEFDNGAATVEEDLSGFTTPQIRSEPQDEQTGELAAALRAALNRWRGADPLTLRYREAPDGQLAGLQPQGVVGLDEDPPPILTLWLLRALRPAVTLPDRAVRLGDRWQEPRAVELAGWSDVRASETAEWLEAHNAGEPAVRLHLVQQLSAKIPAATESRLGAGEVRFHAESLNTLSLAGGRLLAATRSATREVTHELPPVPGMKEPPRFTARLAVQVQMEEIR